MFFLSVAVSSLLSFCCCKSPSAAATLPLLLQVSVRSPVPLQVWHYSPVATITLPSSLHLSSYCCTCSVNEFDCIFIYCSTPSSR